MLLGVCCWVYKLPLQNYGTILYIFVYNTNALDSLIPLVYSYCGRLDILYTSPFFAYDIKYSVARLATLVAASSSKTVNCAGAEPLV